MSRRVGAPKGGRVHWLFLHLPNDFKDNYLYYYNYSQHNYTFYRTIGYSRKLFDLFVIIRTSKHCFHMIYNNTFDSLYLVKSFRTSIECARYMYAVFDDYRNIEAFIPRKTRYL